MSNSGTDAEDGKATADLLIAAGALSSAGGTVDVQYYALKLRIDAAKVRQGLGYLANRSRVTRIPGWLCPSCQAENTEQLQRCHRCDTAASSDRRLIDMFLRPTKKPSRDPAALFLIHGMNTLGDWQQSLAWKTQLLYSYSVPIFAFKFGRDRISPLFRYTQRRHVERLAAAIRRAQSDLAIAGRVARCDVVAHSFGSLLLAQLLSDPVYNDIEFGRVLVSGSIVPRDFRWNDALSSGRVESVLNHRAGKDQWVRFAPWFFPGTGSSGYDGFENRGGTADLISPSFRHSDFFAPRYFDGVVRNVWTPFFTKSALFVDDTPAGTTPKARHAFVGRYWVGRGTLLVTMILCVSAICRLAIATINACHR